MHEWRCAKGRKSLEEEESHDKSERKGRSVGDSQEDDSEELDAAIGTIIRFLELRMQSQPYAQIMAQFTGAHNSRQIDQRQPGPLVPFEPAG